MNLVDENTYELNIRPPASILNVFSRLSYRVWYAIAEFVDNSTQSFISNEEELKKDSNFKKLVVKIKYDSEKNTLTVIDNAFGMEIDKFKNAILLDARNNDQEGRNEFGMGLKTAASWFGNIWSVTSTQYGSTNQYSATININELIRKKSDSIAIHRTETSKNIHGTQIIIKDVTKKITGPRTVGKIRDLLSSMYRRDINNRNIEIWFGEEKIFFKEFPILENFRGKKWKKDLNFYVYFDGKEYNVTGFVAIMDPGSFMKSGFALFRQDRVIIGGTDLNYKPTKIFGQLQSQRSLRLFGELNMNDFPVNQAKDGFIWDDGLEDAFIDALKSNIQEYIDIADMSIKQRENEMQFSEENSRKVQEDVAKAIKLLVNKNSEEKNNEKENNEVAEYKKTILNKEIPEKIVGTQRVYDIPIDMINVKKVYVNWVVGKDDYWINYDEDNNCLKILINIEHPFFMPYSKEENFKKIIEKFVLAFVLSEQQAKVVSDKFGYIYVSSIKNNMNKFLCKFSEE